VKLCVPYVSLPGVPVNTPVAELNATPLRRCPDQENDRSGQPDIVTWKKNAWPLYGRPEFEWVNMSERFTSIVNCLVTSMRSSRR
jgi:hypothetical protein